MSDGLTLPPPPARSEGGIVRRSARLLGRHAGALAAVLGPVALVTAVPSALVETAMMRDLGVDWAQSWAMDPMRIGARWMAVQGIAGLLETFLLLPLLLALAYRLLRGGGGGDGIRAALRAAARVWPRTAGAFALSMVLAILPILPGVALMALGVAVGGPELLDMSMDMREDGAGTMDPRGGLLLTFGMVSMTAGTFVSLFVALSLALAVPVAVLDGARPVAALRASWNRMAGQRWRVIGGQLVLGVPAMVVLIALGGMLGPLGGRFAPALLAGAVASFVTVAILAAVTSVIHADTSPPEPVALDAPAEG